MSKDISAMDSVIKDTKVENKEKIEQKEPTLREMLRFFNVDNRLVWRICTLCIGISVSIFYNIVFLFLPISMIGNFIVETFKRYYRKQDFSHISEQIFEPVKLTSRKYSIYLKTSYWTRFITLFTVFPFLSWYFMRYNACLSDLAAAGISACIVERLLHGALCALKYSYMPYLGKNETNVVSTKYPKKGSINWASSFAASKDGGVIIRH